MTDKLDKSAAGAPPQDTPPAKDSAFSGPPEAIKAIPVRHWGRWVSAVVVVALLALLVQAFANGDIQWHAVSDTLFDSTVVAGAGRTESRSFAPARNTTPVQAAKNIQPTALW